MARRRRRQRVTWVDWVRLAFIVSLFVIPGAYVALSVSAGQWYGRQLIPHFTTTTTSTTTTTTAPPG